MKTRVRSQRILVLGMLAQVAFVASVALGRVEGSPYDFWAGFFAGLAVVGNIVFLYSAARSRGG